MVSPCWIALGLALVAGPVAAQPDWRGAGGPLFVEVRADSLSASEARADEARLAPLNQPFGQPVAAAAERHGLDPKLLHALVTVESAYRADAVSRAGAAGLTQLMPATAADLGVSDRFDPQANLSGGADYLARQLLRFGDLRLALAAYNAGPARVAALGRVPSIPETRAYVQAVVECYLALSAGRGVRRASECRAAVSP
ncbi:MAG: transglycosylase [Phenylobacterium sp. RIFCSPHIGHO2_01_FULL_69_31]|uniref:lytic transglycosylase domain-containing protein n=1 Tax=Phenylobacterium sp. RIFCSPHIGHO2_01_FULL_69_31 TaxID=1801944 RepID=UPI0008B8298D|nr:lytic transglycosylase domain-containing protein [Phenylobacterium sp. RIFCSPHIGHO2_01_FULL_69_31]OHB31140.1 MAG: transglycosylase [Phenylobacterium sp. RIFCSPHIGHO2_01_FULL_69_31]